MRSLHVEVDDPSDYRYRLFYPISATGGLSMVPAGRPGIGPLISTRFTDVQLIRIDGAAARAGQSRAEWLRATAERALGELPVVQDFDRDHFTQAASRSGYVDGGRFDAVVLWMSEGEWGLAQRPREDKLVPTNEVQVEVSPGGRETPTGPAVRDAIESVVPHIERVIRGSSVDSGRLFLGEDAKRALELLEGALDTLRDDMEMIPDATEYLVDNISDDELLATNDVAQLVAESAASLREELGWWVEETRAEEVLEERIEELREG